MPGKVSLDVGAFGIGECTSGRRRINSSANASLQALFTNFLFFDRGACSHFVPIRPYSMFLYIVSLNKNGSCWTRPI